MSGDVGYFWNRASEREIRDHLTCCDAEFLPRLSSRVDISEYARKIARNSMRVEAWSGAIMVGLAALYCNDRETRRSYITSVSVLMGWSRRGIATQLIGKCIDYTRTSGMNAVGLEVASDNVAAINLYERIGFVSSKSKEQLITMTYLLSIEGKNE